MSSAARQAYLVREHYLTDLQAMWREPYLETCCRSAMHRLSLSGEVGRPVAVGDQPCLQRLTALGFAAALDGRYRLTAIGSERHRYEILKVEVAPPSG